jgi:hypothetical protein
MALKQHRIEDAQTAKVELEELQVFNFMLYSELVVNSVKNVVFLHSDTMPNCVKRLFRNECKYFDHHIYCYVL